MSRLLLFNDLDLGSNLVRYGSQIAGFLGSAGDKRVLRLAEGVPGGHSVYFAEKKVWKHLGYALEPQDGVDSRDFPKLSGVCVVSPTTEGARRKLDEKKRHADCWLSDLVKDAVSQGVAYIGVRGGVPMAGLSKSGFYRRLDLAPFHFELDFPLSRDEAESRRLNDVVSDTKKSVLALRSGAIVCLEDSLVEMKLQILAGSVKLFRPFGGSTGYTAGQSLREEKYVI